MTARQNPRVVAGISGGVDSSVAAWLLKEQGFEVIGLFMKNWEEDDDKEYCGAAEDLAVAEEICERIGIPLQTVNFSHEYWERVFGIFLNEYRAGRTPNPDVLCNREIKFCEFLDFATTLGAEFIATGHYARVQQDGALTQLLKGADPEKDQSYFLHQVSQSALARTLFPVGDLQKTEVRAQARSLGLPNSERKDSTGICFIGERRFKDFLARYLPPEPGEIRTLNEESIGQHDGLWFYTLGQRHGLDIGGAGAPWYVAAKDMSTNILYVVQGHDHPALLRHTIQAIKPHWIGGYLPDTPLVCSAKIRYRQSDQPCRLLQCKTNSIEVSFQGAQRAVTPGQSVVLYTGNVVLGGATICAAADTFATAS